MIYLLITTSINNNYIHLEKMVDAYSPLLKKNKPNTNEHTFFSNRNSRRNPIMKIRMGNMNNLIIPHESNKEKLTMDLVTLKEFNTNDRISEYKESIKNTLSYILDGIKPIIIENNGKRDTFLNEFGIDVLYTENNENSFKHKGINELMDIKSAISEYNIQDNDIVIKMTGRYKFIDNSFFRTVIENSHSHDAFMKFFNVAENKFLENDCILGLFAIRCKYLKSFDYDSESEIPETQFADYVRKTNCKIYEMERLGLNCKFSDTQKTLDV